MLITVGTYDSILYCHMSFFCINLTTTFSILILKHLEHNMYNVCNHYAASQFITFVALIHHVVSYKLLETFTIEPNTVKQITLLLKLSQCDI